MQKVNLRRPKLERKLYKGKESFQKQLFKWSIEEVEWDRSEIVSKRWSSLSHSGVFSHLDDVYRIGRMKSEIRKTEKMFRFGAKEDESFRPLTLKSTVISIFIIYLVFATFCISVLLAEKIHDSFHDYKSKLKAWLLTG